MLANLNTILLPTTIRGRSLYERVIPSVCNLKNMLKKLDEVNGDLSQLKQWEKSSFRSYQSHKVKTEILQSTSEEKVSIIKKHILGEDPNELGPHCIDIYLVALVAENYGVGKGVFLSIFWKVGFPRKRTLLKLFGKWVKEMGFILVF